MCGALLAHLGGLFFLDPPKALLGTRLEAEGRLVGWGGEPPPRLFVCDDGPGATMGRNERNERTKKRTNERTDGRTDERMDFPSPVIQRRRYCFSTCSGSSSSGQLSFF